MMESWLEDVKRVRIPRPKFGTTSSSESRRSGYPMEPPKDYQYDAVAAAEHHMSINELAKATDELRRAIQEKL